MIEILELSDRDFKITMVNKIKEIEERTVKLDEVMDKTDEKCRISTEIWKKKKKESTEHLP